MSAGAVFKLIANDGKADRMIMATKLLNQRIKDVMCARKQGGKTDITPTLVDLERTHILYVNAHFKPFAAIGYEYNKVRPQSGNQSLGSGVTFSIPQFGDFFHDMVVRTRLGLCHAHEGTTPVQSDARINGKDPVFPFNTGTTLGTDVVTTYNLVDAAGNVVVTGVKNGATPTVKYRNFVRYCEYPGNRLFHLVKFDVNGNPLDQYDEMIPLMLEKFCTPPNKRAGYDRLVGQEVPLNGYGGLCYSSVVDADSDNTPLGINKAELAQSNQTVGLFAAKALGGASATLVGQTALAPLNANLAVSSTTKQYDVSRHLQQVVNGPQTPKPVQAPLEVWNKLRFWFNDDVRLSVASVSIPFGQRYISIDLCTQAQLVFEYPSLFVETSVTSSNGLSHTKTYKPYFVKNGVTDMVVEKMEMYINNIFVNPEVHDIYIKRIGFSLIRVYRQHTQRCNNDGSSEVLLSQLKWPIEYMFIGVRPAYNTKDSNHNQWRDWHRLTRVVDAECDDACLSTMVGVTGETGTSDPETFQYGLRSSSVGKVVPDNYYLPVPTVDSLSLTSHGIVIFDGFNDTFFNQYLPFHYGGQALVTPDDPGALFVNMALFPRSYQPSGHLNISRARETYLKWTTSYMSSNSAADLIAVAVAINFLLVTDGSAVLRYST